MQKFVIRSTGRAAFRALLCFTPLFAVSAVTWGQSPSRDQLARQVRAKVVELQELQRQAQARRIEHARETEEMEAQIDRLGQDVAAVRSDIAQMEQRITGRRSRLADLRQTAADANARLEAAATIAATLVESVRARAATGIPAVRDTASRWAELTAALRSDAPTDRADALVSFHESLGDYLQQHRERVITNRLVDQPRPGVARHAYVARLGGVLEMFVTEDGRTAGCASRLRDGPWRAPLEDDRHDAVSRAVAVLRDQAPPRLIALPISTAREDEASR